MIFDTICTVSAFSLVQGRNTFSSVPRMIVVHSCLERCPCLSLGRAPVGGRRFRPQFWTYTIRIFFFAVLVLCGCRVDSRLATMCIFSDTSCPVPLWVSLMVALSVSRMCRNRDTAFSVVACCALVAHFFFLVSSISVHGSGRKFCSLVHIEFCVKTLHLGTVSLCLAWSSPLPRYCCSVDCLHCDQDI